MQTPGRTPALDGLRAVAISMVLLYHFGVEWASGDVGVSLAGEAYLYNAFETRFDAIAIGCALAALVRVARGRAIIERLASSSWRQRPPRRQRDDPRSM